MDKDEKICWELARKKIECPYFKRALRNGITCEGFLPGTNTQINFMAYKDKKAYMDDFCTTPCWEGCTIAQLAAEKYGE